MLTGLVMSGRLGQRRALRRIERDLLRSDPGLDALFLLLSQPGKGKGMLDIDRGMLDIEKIRPAPLRLVRRLGRRARRHRPGEDAPIRRRTIR